MDDILFEILLFAGVAVLILILFRKKPEEKKECKEESCTNDYQEYVGSKCPPHNWDKDKKGNMFCQTCGQGASTK